MMVSGYPPAIQSLKAWVRLWFGLHARYLKDEKKKSPVAFLPMVNYRSERAGVRIEYNKFQQLRVRVGDRVCEAQEQIYRELGHYS